MEIIDYRSLEWQKIMDFLMKQMPKSVYLIGDMLSGSGKFSMFVAVEDSDISGIILYYWGIPGSGITWILGDHQTVERFIKSLDDGTFVILTPVELEKKLQERFRDVRSYPEHIMLCTGNDEYKTEIDFRILGPEYIDQWGFLQTERKSISREENDQFLRTLTNQTCFGIFVDKIMVSGAVIETSTPEMAVIGSVKTLSVYRNKGYATSLMASIVGYCHNKRQVLYLFVRKDNLAAITAYRKVGFSIVDEILISYIGLNI